MQDYYLLCTLVLLAVKADGGFWGEMWSNWKVSYRWKIINWLGGQNFPSNQEQKSYRRGAIFSLLMSNRDFIIVGPRSWVFSIYVLRLISMNEYICAIPGSFVLSFPCTKSQPNCTRFPTILLTNVPLSYTTGYDDKWMNL